MHAKTHSARLSPRELAKFTAGVALLGIFFDAAIGHGLLWENDPYWTYWITKTFLIATIFGLGTAWLGIGLGRGALITLVHTLVLEIYYWSLSPIGLPSHPEWLDLDHVWISGTPVHFGVIYLGYLLTLWIWQRRARLHDTAALTARFGLRALIAGLIIVLGAGGAASLVLGEFPGVTWFVVRLLLSIPFLLVWWALAGNDRVSAIVGGLLLALIWTTYGHFLGPVGLPDLPLRILNPEPPGATSRWLGYEELWLISLPIYALAMVIVLLLSSRGAARTGPSATVSSTIILTALLLVPSGLVEPNRGQSVTLRADGPVKVETGPFFSGSFETGTASIEVSATDFAEGGSRVTPLPPHDTLNIAAQVMVGGRTFGVKVDRAMIEDPLGRHGTWWGVGLHVEHHGRSGTGTRKLPTIRSEFAAFGLGEVTLDGQTIAVGVPVHVMTAETGIPGKLELDVGDEDLPPIPNLPHGHLRVLWETVETHVPDPPPGRYALGGVVLIVLLAGMVWLNRREARQTRS